MKHGAKKKNAPQAVDLADGRVAVQYVGKRLHYTDGAYGSYIEFSRGQSLALPADLAKKLLRHPDQYAPGDSGAIKADPKTTQKEDLEEHDQQVRDSIAILDKDALIDFAQLHFHAKVERSDVYDMRAKVTGMFEQFGLS